MHLALSFRPLSRRDFHCSSAGWRSPTSSLGGATWTPRSLRQNTGPASTASSRGHVFIIEHEGRSIGWIQWYLRGIDPDEATHFGAPDDSAGIDLVIGEPNMIGRGVGPACIRQFLDEQVFVNPAIRAVVTDPEAANARSVRAFQKAGFVTSKITSLPGENIQRNIMKLDRAS